MRIRTKLPENCAMKMIKEIVKESIFKIKSLSRLDDKVRGLLKIKADRVEEIIRNASSICDAIVLSSREAKVLIREHTCLIALPILESGCIITSVDVKTFFGI